MTIRDERTVLDTNIWIFGLRRTAAHPACASLLDRLRELTVVLPRQVLGELQTNLTDGEIREFFRLISLHPGHTALDWQRAPLALVTKYERLAWRRGDAVVAAHLEHLGVPLLISENRTFLRGASDVPFRLLTAAEALAELNEVSRT